MGRKKRNTAKTGDVALYKSRDNTSEVSQAKKLDDNDATYNEVDRYHNAKDDLRNDLLKFNQSDDDESDGGIHDDREAVLDLGMEVSSSESEDSDSESEEETVNETNIAASSDDSDTDESSIGNEMNEEAKETDLLNWGNRKKDYYHGDTADLEIGQEVEDAELEEEAGREVLKARMEQMSEDDFKIDDSDFDEDHESNEKEPKNTVAESIRSTKRKKVHEMSEKEKIKHLKRSHPELLPLVTHFREDAIRPCAEETLVVTDCIFKDKNNAEAIGSSKAGLQYLLTKTMLQTSTALNVCQYLLLKADMAAKELEEEEDFGFDQQEEEIANHPVVARLDQLNKLSEKLHEEVETKVPGLDDQLKSLVKASALLGDPEAMNTVESEESEEEDNDILADHPENQSTPDSASDSESSSDEEDMSEVQRKVMTEARFSLRPEDDNYDLEIDGESSSKAKRRLRRRALVPAFEDYGDDDKAANEKDITAAGQSLASTLNTLTQRGKSRTASSTSRPEAVDGEDEDRFKRGLAMMDAELGGDSDIGGEGDEEDISDDELDDDLGEDDFYSQIKKKSKAKKEYKKSLYAVAPKYPGMDDEVEGERAVGKMIMNNRGLVPHRKKEFRNPRLKRREQYRKAIIRRKGAIREIRTDEGHKYGGEETGIKSNLSRSRKLAN